MKVKLKLSVDQKQVLDDVLDIDDTKLELLSEEEIEQAIEVYIAEWSNEHVQIHWEVEEAVGESSEK
ncbi:MAG: hypothetical protein K0R75_127 [Paenibacillaceae bacterium]|nr:hypothetical protein [Paenibacillaceae bacterium]